ncbi:Cyclochlorotine biosynthesis protein O, partial [Lachnellula arida]
MNKERDQIYEPLSHDDSHSSDTADVDEHQSHESVLFVRRRSQRSRQLLPWLLRIIEIFVVMASLAFGTFGFIWYDKSSDQACPIEPFFRPEWDHIKDSGLAWTAHLTGSESSVFMGEPSMEREAAWEQLLKDRAVTLNAAQIEVLNTKGEIPSLAGETTGSGTYIGYQLMSGMDYQLHCIGLIRQWSYWDYYQTAMTELPPVYMSAPEDAHALVDFCLESLRLQVLCSSNEMRFLVPNATSITGYRAPIVLQKEEVMWQCARNTSYDVIFEN